MRNTLVIGADVFHHKKHNSMGAVCASYGQNLQYSISHNQVHNKGREIFNNLDEIIGKFLD